MNKDATPTTKNIESETFDTWTVIKDKAIPSMSEEEEEIADEADGVETLNDSDDKSDNRFSESEDLSDGISIISECESAGRMSPHPELAKHLSELNKRFAEVIEPSLRSINNTNDINSPYYEGSSEQSSEILHKAEPLTEINRKLRKTSRQTIDSPQMKPKLTIGLRGLFYIGALLGVLALISKLKYDLVLETDTSVLNQKIDDLELKNNFMQAEIDILAKQVNYLTTLNENLKYSTSFKQKNNPSKEKKVKVWPGNGNIIEEKVLNTKDLKKPFKCEGDNNLDIAGMCVELPQAKENIVEALGNKVKSVLNENDHLINIENVVEKVIKLTENPFGEKEDKPLSSQDDKIETVNESDYTPHEHNPEKYDKHEKYDTPHEHKPEKYDKHEKYDKKYNQKPDTYERKKHDTNQKQDKHDNKKYDNKRDNFKKHKNDDSNESKERYYKDRSNEDFNGSGEKYKKSKDNKKNDKYSSPEYEKDKRDADGLWHERLMKHRENYRKNNGKYNRDNNWFIERGDGREQARNNDGKNRLK